MGLLSNLFGGHAPGEDGHVPVDEYDGSYADYHVDDVSEEVDCGTCLGDGKVECDVHVNNPEDQGPCDGVELSQCGTCPDCDGWG